MVSVFVKLFLLPLFAFKLRRGSVYLEVRSGRLVLLFTPGVHDVHHKERKYMSHGFTKINEMEIREMGSTAHVYRHDKTGARVLSIVNDDENKVFGISFRTPPEDSTGVAHILEHSVL